METYILVKATHILCAVLSISLFIMRGVWHLQNSVRLERPWVRVLPHAIDTILLASAVWLMVITGQYPGPTLWLNVKLVAVVLYIGLGIVAFRFARNTLAKLVAWLSAVLAFVMTVVVALTR